ncbi:GRB10-interacting GYF protein 2-like isoform X3 [Corticium candelabrum]|uniref:GRB10-interacting GYF protein 2-like isoform X3 n=1 Tax=Corticium candelabrum TaxID=121492 RepID=UPI002E273EF6|nr:GRB10-interacting GYF protein 2-like isoform X3 [Corticium candelabrum]
MSDMTFGPQWLRDLSAGGGQGIHGSTPPPPSIVSPQIPYQFKLADHRYGREEMLALYIPDPPVPQSLKCDAPIVKEKALQPMSFLPFSEEEQRSQVQGVNSKLVSRGPARGVRPGNSIGSPVHKLGRPGRPREGSYQRGTPVDDNEDAVGGSNDVFERKAYEIERPGNYRMKGDVSRSGRSSNWRSGTLEDGGGDLWKTLPMSPGPKSPDKWHVVGPRHGWKDHIEPRDRFIQQPPRRLSDKDRPNDTHDSAASHHRIGGRWDKLHEGEERTHETTSEESEEMNREGSKGEIREERTSKGRVNRDEFLEDKATSNRKREISPPKKEASEDRAAGLESAAAVEMPNRPHGSVSNGAIHPQHATHADDQLNTIELYAGNKQEKTAFAADSVTTLPPTSPRSEQTMKLYAAGRGRGRGSAIGRPRLPKLDSSSSVPDGSQPDVSRTNRHTSPVSVRPGRMSREEEEEIIEGLEQSARSLVADVVEDDDRESASVQQQLFANTKIIKQHHQLAKKLDIRMPFQPAPSVQQPSVQRAFTQPTSSGSLNSVPASQPLQPSHPLELMSQWYYTDPQGDVQGPFKSDEMLDWMRNGYFRMDLLIRRACDKEFKTLGEMIKLCGRVPFTQGEAPTSKPGLSQWQSMNLAQQQMLAHLQQQQSILQQQQKQPQQLMKDTVTTIEPPLIPSVENGASVASSIWSGAPGGDIWSMPVHLGGTSQLVWDSNMKKSDVRPRDSSHQNSLTQDDKVITAESNRIKEELNREQQQWEMEERQRQLREEEQRVRREEEKKRLQEEQIRKREEEKQKQEENQRLEEEQRRQEEEQRRRREEEQRRRREEEQRRRREEEQERQEKERKHQETERLKKEKAEELKQLQEEARRQQQLALQKQQLAARQKQEVAARQKQEAAAVTTFHQQQMQQNEMLIRLQQQQADVQRKQMQQTSRVSGWKPVQSSVSLVEIQQQEAERERQRQQQKPQQQQQQQQQQQHFQPQSAGWSAKVQGSAAPSLAQIQQEQIGQDQTRLAQQLPQQISTMNQGWSKAPVAAPTVWNQPVSSSTMSVGRGNAVIVPSHAPSSSKSFWDDLPSVESPVAASVGKKGRGSGVINPQQNVAPAPGDRKVEAREEDLVRRHFQSKVEISEDFWEWCQEKLTPFKNVVHAHTLVEFLQVLDSVSEVSEYVEAYLGNSVAAQEFARGFIERHTKKVKKATAADVIKGQKSTVPPTDSYAAFPSLGDSGPSVKLPVGGNPQVIQQEQVSKPDATGPKGRRKKKRMQKVPAANFLSYSVNASERPNKGEVKSAFDAQ